MKLVGEVGNWKIVAHIAFKFYSVASGTFSTGSTPALSGRGEHREPRAAAARCSASYDLRDVVAPRLRSASTSISVPKCNARHSGVSPVLSR